SPITSQSRRRDVIGDCSALARGGAVMLMQAIDSYLQLRRAGGYQLRDTEVLLKEFACFAAERGEIHIKADTAIAWASRATSQQQRARRLNNLILFARYIRAEDAEQDRKSTRLNSSH